MILRMIRLNLRMSVDFKFQKEEDGRWYVVLPDYPGPKANLEMVLGADDLLDSIANDGELEVNLRVSLTEREWSDGLLERSETESDVGRFYHTANVLCGGVEYAGEQIWLCPVMLYVFGRYPRKIYYEII